MAAGSLFSVVVLGEGAPGHEARVAGLPAISRILIEAARAGAECAYVVPVGAENLARRVRWDLERAGCQLDVHWLDPDAIRGAIERQGPGRLLVLSRRALVHADGLRRLLDHGRECGLHLYGRNLAALLARRPVRLSALDNISHGLARLRAEPGEVILLDDEAAATRDVLRRTVKPTDGVVSRCLNRPLSRTLSAFVLRWDGVRPMHMTVVTAVVALAMFAVLLFGGPAGLIAGGLLFQLASVVDGVDGEIARSTYRSSPRGAVLDTTVDMITNLLFVLGLTVSLGRLHGPLYWAVGGFGFAAFLFGVLSLSLMARFNRASAGFDMLKVVYGQSFTSGFWAGAMRVTKAVLSRDFFALAFAALCVAGLARAIPFAFAGAACLWLGFIAAAPLLLSRRPDPRGASAGAQAPPEPAEAMRTASS